MVKAKISRKIVPIPIKEIKGAVAKMRLQEDREMDELMASISQNGILNPLMLSRTGKGHILFSGHRRLAAARALGFDTVPAVVYDDLSESAAALKGFIDNLNRKDFTPLEQAYSHKTLVEKYGYTQEELSASTGKSMSAIASYIRLLNRVPREILEAVTEEKISFGHARLLMKIPDPTLMIKVFRELLRKRISVEDLRFMLVRMKPDKELKPKEKALDRVEDLIEENKELQALWGTELEIHRSRIGDRLELDFRDSSDLTGKLQTLLSALRRALKQKS